MNEPHILLADLVIGESPRWTSGGPDRPVELDPLQHFPALADPDVASASAPGVGWP